MRVAGRRARDARFEQGAASEVTTTFVNLEDVAAQDVKVRLAVPEGWTVAGDGTGTVEPGGKLVTTWKVTPPAAAPYDTYELKANAAYTGGGGRQVARRGDDGTDTAAAAHRGGLGRATWSGSAPPTAGGRSSATGPTATSARPTARRS